MLPNARRDHPLAALWESVRYKCTSLCGRIEGIAEICPVRAPSREPLNIAPMASQAADEHLNGKIIIEGITTEGRRFRPSDWAERMSGALSTFRGRRIQYSPYLQPMAREGIKCIIVDPALKQHNPELFNYIMNFARSNHLNIIREE